MNQLDEESDETHDGESDRRCDSNLLVLFPIGLSTSLHQSNRVFSELAAGLNECLELIHYRLELVNMFMMKDEAAVLTRKTEIHKEHAASKTSLLQRIEN